MEKFCAEIIADSVSRLKRVSIFAFSLAAFRESSSLSSESFNSFSADSICVLPAAICACPEPNPAAAEYPPAISFDCCSSKPFICSFNLSIIAFCTLIFTCRLESSVSICGRRTSTALYICFNESIVSLENCSPYPICSIQETKASNCFGCCIASFTEDGIVIPICFAASPIVAFKLLNVLFSVLYVFSKPASLYAFFSAFNALWLAFKLLSSASYAAFWDNASASFVCASASFVFVSSCLLLSVFSCFFNCSLLFFKEAFASSILSLASRSLSFVCPRILSFIRSIFFSFSRISTWSCIKPFADTLATSSCLSNSPL